MQTEHTASRRPALLQLLKRLYYSGVEPGALDDPSRRTLVVNGAALTCATIAIIFIAVDWIAGNFVELGLVVLGGLLCVLPLWLNTRGRRYAAKLVLAFTVHLMSLGGALAEPAAEMGSIALIPLSMGALVIFLPEERISRWFFTIFPVAAFVYLEGATLLGLPMPPHSQAEPSAVVFAANIIAAAAVLAVLVRHLVSGYRLIVAQLQSALRELKAQQALTVHAARMSALGELSAGVAHEVNNPLTALLLANDRLLSELSKEAPSAEAIRLQAQRQATTAKRIVRIVRALLAFAREESEQPPQPVQLSKMVAGTLDLCAERFERAGVRLEVRVPEDQWVLGREMELSQALLNLLLNAFDAAQGSSNKWARLGTSIETDALELWVEDSGPGIAPENQARLMEPFFTTKGQGKGTGLGLSVSKGLLESVSGTLRYEPQAPHTRFVIQLRRTEPPPSA